MKTVDAESLKKKIRHPRKKRQEKYNFDVEILEEGDLEK